MIDLEKSIDYLLMGFCIQFLFYFSSEVEEVVEIFAFVF